MVTINIYEGAAKQAENAAQGSEAPAPQGNLRMLESIAASAPAPENIALGSQIFASSAPPPSLFNGAPLAEAVPAPSGQGNMQESGSSSAPAPTTQIDVFAADISAPAPSMQMNTSGNAQTDMPIPSLEPGESDEETE